MKNLSRRLGSSGGFTLLELLIAVAIISILAAIATVSYASFQAHVRYSQMRANMDAIAMAGYTDYTSNTIWAPLQMAGTLPPSFAATSSLQIWPDAPCPGWSYGWDNLSDSGGLSIANVVRVTLRDVQGNAIWSYCVDTIGGSGNCAFPDPFTNTVPMDLTSPPTEYVYCTE